MYICSVRMYIWRYVWSLPLARGCKPRCDIYFPFSPIEDDVAVWVLLQAMVPSAGKQELSYGNFSNWAGTIAKP